VGFVIAYPLPTHSIKGVPSDSEIVFLLLSCAIYMPYPNWEHFPKNRSPSSVAQNIVKVFENNSKKIDSRKAKKRLKSNDVLAILSADLLEIENMEVEHRDEDGTLHKIDRPVLYGEGGKARKSFQPDGYHNPSGLIFEVEAGMTVPNNMAYKDLIKACLMEGTNHFVLAVPLFYDGGGSKSNPYSVVVRDFSAIFESARLQLPLETVTVIGY